MSKDPDLLTRKDRVHNLVNKIMEPSSLVQQIRVAPVLSTPDTHIFEDPTPPIKPSFPRLDDEQLLITYEVERTVREIRDGKWKRIALQFPDHMLADAPRVCEELKRGLKRKRQESTKIPSHEVQETTTANMDNLVLPGITGLTRHLANTQFLDNTIPEHSIMPQEAVQNLTEKLFILGDTSYGACCVDEIAAEHADADVVVHYGRSCLSPTARIPVIYVFTKPPLDLQAVMAAFSITYLDRTQKIIIMADIPYATYIPHLAKRLRDEGYTNIFSTELIHDPSSPLPNRTVPSEVGVDVAKLQDYQVFHISDPPTALLLTLSSRAGDIHIYPTTTNISGSMVEATLVSASRVSLRRRYALLTSLTTTPVFGILINTLSVKNYMHVVSYVNKLIEAAGKKSYTFVVGKVNAAKLANFGEIGGWVVIGCWESSLIENKEFYRPVITPWELELALQSDADRVWTGEWKSDFNSILEESRLAASEDHKFETEDDPSAEGQDFQNPVDNEDFHDEDESEPPEFDLRTGRYVSRSRPMRNVRLREPQSSTQISDTSQSLIKRANGDVIQVGGVASPGAEYLKEERTWQGLGSDFETTNQRDGEVELGARVEEGRSGVARGYTVGEDRNRS